MNELCRNADLEHQPLAFGGLSSKGYLQESDFRDRVAVVLSFVAGVAEGSASVIQNLDRSLLSFAQRRVQLIVVLPDEPVSISRKLLTHVPLLRDENLRSELFADHPSPGQIASVIIGNDGMALDIVRQEVVADQAAAILVSLDRLKVQFPKRFSVLPDPYANKTEELIEDPLGRFKV
jgi:hypothetical protein